MCRFSASSRAAPSGAMSMALGTRASSPRSGNRSPGMIQRPRGKRDGPLDPVAQLAHVARPVVLARRFVGQRRDADGVALDRAGKLGKEPVDQPLDVLDAARAAAGHGSESTLIR